RDQLKEMLPIGEIERLQLALKFSDLELQYAAVNAERYGAALTREDTLFHLREQDDMFRRLATGLEERRKETMRVNLLTEEQARNNRTVLEIDQQIYETLLARARVQEKIRVTANPLVAGEFSTD